MDLIILYNPRMPLPLLWISLSFLSGIVLNRFLHLPLGAWLIVVSIPVLLGWSNLKRFPALKSYDAWVMTAAFIALWLGALRYEQSVGKVTPFDVSWYNDRKYDVLVSGTLTGPPDYRDAYTNLRLSVNQIDSGKHAFDVHGLLLVRVPANQTYEYGDALRLRGQLQTPPVSEDFSYRDYLERQGILSYMPNAEATRLPGDGGNPIVHAIYAIRERSFDNIYRLFPDPEASLLAGILLGDASGLPDSIQQAFKNTGTAHIIAISGFNISIVAGIFVTFFSRMFGARRGALAAISGIAFYTFLVGASASVVRAALMATLALFALQVGRRQQGLNTLGFVAALMALWNPLVLWDAGFQLSFFATLGLILYGEPFRLAAENFLARYLSPSRALQAAKLLTDYVLLTLAAQLTTLPIMAYQFKQISLVSIIANPFILPAQPAVEILGGLAGFF